MSSPLDFKVAKINKFTLWTTVVGSHLWNMPKEASDLDLSTVYAVVTKDVLANRNYHPTVAARKYIPENSRWGHIEHDEQAQEILHLIEQLYKGNVNAILTTCSTVVYYDDPRCRREQLADIVIDNLSKQSYFSIKGLAAAQRADAYKHTNRFEKNLKSCMRTLRFGIHLLKYGELKFEPVFKVPHPYELEDAFIALDMACDESDLPETIDKKPFIDFLLDVREEYWDR